LTKYDEFNNSAYECGKLVNLILKRLVSPKTKTFSIISVYKNAIIKTCRSHFDYLCKTLINLKTKKQVEFEPQNYAVSSPIIRLLLIESVLLMSKATGTDKTCLVNEINATLWHSLLLFYFSSRFF